MDSRPQTRQVAVLVETDDSWGCSVIRGIADYSQNHGHWNLLLDPQDHDQRSALPDLWNGDGVIVRFGNRLQIDQVRKRKVPVVNVDTLFEGLPGVCDVITDDAERAQLAFHHLRDRGFEKFAYFAPPNHRYSSKRGEEFIQLVRSVGLECHEYKPGYRVGRKIGWEEQQRRVSRWLASLPRPIAIFTVDAQRGRQLAEICYMAGIRVPDQVAILAGDTDDLMCEVCTPPALKRRPRRPPHRLRSRRGSRPHDERRTPPHAAGQDPPHGVISRQSTDILAIDDDTVVRALRFIQQRAFQDIVVKDILHEVPVSRRSLEIQFRRYLGRSPAEEIRRVRLDKGRELLARTDMSIGEIASACGFANGTRFGVAFRKRFGKTPLAYRKQLTRS